MAGGPATAEERKVLKAARVVIGRGPDRVLVNAKGDAERPRSFNPDDPGVLLTNDARFTFVRDDGWTLGTIGLWKLTAEEMWRSDWIGRIEFMPGWNEQRERAETYAHVYVISAKFGEYKAGVLDMEGLMLPELEEDNLKEHRAGADSMSLEELRDWMRKGCPLPDSAKHPKEP